LCWLVGCAGWLRWLRWLCSTAIAASQHSQPAITTAIVVCTSGWLSWLVVLAGWLAVLDVLAGWLRWLAKPLQAL
jgi:hypothetical protein